MKIASHIISLVLVAAVIGPSFAYAQDLNTSPAPAPTEQADAVAEVTEVEPEEVAGETPTLAQTKEELTDEEKLTRARDGLNKALTLALEKVSKLRDDLDSREFAEESREAAMKAEFLAELGSFEAFYEERLAEMESLVTLEEIQTSAAGVKAYRDDVYAEGVEGIVQFILVFYAQDVIGTANDRYTNIAADIQKLEEFGLLEEEVFAEQKTEIEALLSDAQALRDQAHGFITSPPAEETPEPIAAEASPIGAVDEATGATEEAEPAETEPTAKELLGISLSNVKTAYERFIEISQSVKETLGIE